MSAVNEQPINSDEVDWVEDRIEALDIKADAFGLEEYEIEEYNYLDAWADGYARQAQTVRTYRAKAVAK